MLMKKHCIDVALTQTNLFFREQSNYKNILPTDFNFRCFLNYPSLTIKNSDSILLRIYCGFPITQVLMFNNAAHCASPFLIQLTKKADLRKPELTLNCLTQTNYIVYISTPIKTRNNLVLQKNLGLTG